MGEVTNLVSVDSQRIVDTFPYSNSVWTGPYTILLALYFLYMELGVACLSGVGVLLLLIPFNLWGTRKGEQLQREQLTAKDDRVRLMGEVCDILKCSTYDP